MTTLNVGTRRRALDWLAGATGTALRLVGKSIPGTVGPVCVAAGLWMAWPPLGVVFFGVVLWALDRRV
ncbi:MAG TPA: hypothetical protein VFR23_20695 [Jiangellaceae bacterium]|nr:hypothetical protein [Jiangellaceae bacterium]